MFRKLTMVAVPTMALVLTLFVTDNSASQAFAKGGARGGQRMGHNHRGFNRNFRHFNRYGSRYGWGYPSYGFYGYEAPVYEPVVAACASCEPVVAPAVAPVCTTCDSSDVAVESGYAPSWGYGHDRNNYRGYGRFQGHGGRGGGRRR
ncbi:MAG TPA: hypothetical protein VMR25_19285 [Planctomycetaceae bacterium]|jgi:hypothetical protein|nr:hypothetical protein [Planctomycetaceae bacterium]